MIFSHKSNLEISMNQVDIKTQNRCYMLSMINYGGCVRSCVKMFLSGLGTSFKCLWYVYLWC